MHLDEVAPLVLDDLGRFGGRLAGSFVDFACGLKLAASQPECRYRRRAAPRSRRRAGCRTCKCKCV